MNEFDEKNNDLDSESNTSEPFNSGLVSNPEHNTVDNSGSAPSEKEDVSAPLAPQMSQNGRTDAMKENANGGNSFANNPWNGAQVPPNSIPVAPPMHYPSYGPIPPQGYQPYASPPPPYYPGYGQMPPQGYQPGFGAVPPTQPVFQPGIGNAVPLQVYNPNLGNQQSPTLDYAAQEAWTDGQLRFDENGEIKSDFPEESNATSDSTIQFDPMEIPTAKKRNAGLRVFCAMLILLVIASASLTGGYFLGNAEKNVKQNNVVSNSTNIPLNNKPSDSSNKVVFKTTEIAESVKPSVVGIVIYSLKDTQIGGQASGVIISKDGYILTNDHIYEGTPSAKFLVITSDGKEYDGEFIAGDKRSDLAVLKINATGLKPAVFGNSEELQVGEQVIAIGNPGGMMLSSTVTQGVVSGVNRRISVSTNYSMKLIQTDTAISPGNSGGALVNIYGQVIGINSSKLVAEGFEGISFAIPSTVAKSVAESLMINKSVVDRAKIGITYRAVDSVSARQNNTVPGLYIVSISKESDLAGKGFGEGDIVTHINNQPVSDDGQFLDIIEACKPGDTVELTIRKSGGTDRKVTVSLLPDVGSSSYKE